MEQYNLHTTDLVNRFYKGNIGAMTSIMQNAGLPLHFMDDIFNESLEEVWKMNNKGQVLTNFNRFFINRIFKNNVLNFAQKERLRTKVDLSNTSSANSAKNWHESKVELDHLEYLLNLMEPKCRQIISLFHEGYSNEEIGEIMQLQKATVATYKSTCFDKLEQLIATKM
ncbi:MAG: sigma-70 family RNA polymerase sigma factor [Saprospiraceae bacterium]|nr:sigma-70 family RNA polymerase sigma factor [Saprospiraceae bacterium]MBK7738805.1 sigma-70 family RNA polymerase sigma factor [Saprospiraceae bacterium]MBK7912623.1 sigma-70 family RNA polymerase sigma factor [Saprospiraceae bacterium]